MISKMRFLILAMFLSQPTSGSASVDVCQRVPGAEVARLFGRT